jgi:proline iminopeptidase
LRVQAAVNGTQLFYELAGAGPPTMVVCPGGPGFDHGHLRPGLDPLAADVQLVYVDPRGTGESAPVAVQTCTLEQMADDVAALCAVLGVERTIVFGHSAGGFVALQTALRHPELVAGLVLCETSPTLAPIPDDDPPPSLLERAGPEAAEVAGRMFAGDASPETQMAFARLVAPFYSGPAYMDVPIELFPLSRLNGEITQYFFTTLGPHYDVRPRLGGISVPVLVTAGGWDWVVAPARSRAIAAGIPDATLVEFPESGHFPFSEEPERFQQAVREYLTRHARS